MLGQLNIAGKDKVEVAIERLRTFEPPEGYYLAFSGGKDSVVIKALADMAGVKYDAHYHLTSVDPPELVQFVKTFPDVAIDKPRYPDGKQITMWNLIQKKHMPPTRIVRYCCEELKEGGGVGRFTVTGVRWEESARRRRDRSGLELNKAESKKTVTLMDPDNPDNEEMTRVCPTKGKHILNPIIDWTTEDVWEFIRAYNVPYCSLYDEGFKRLGCIGCPMSSRREKEFERWPTYKAAYLRAFDKMLSAAREKRPDKVFTKDWQTAQDVFDWWVKGR